MDDDPLRCDVCARESWPDGSIVLVVRDEDDVTRVRSVRVTCGAGCSSSTPRLADVDGDAIECSFGKIDDVLDYADALIAAHDWERGTVQRLSRVLAALHRRRAK